MIGGLLHSHRIGRVLGIEVRVSFLLYILVGIFVLGELPRGIGFAFAALVVYGSLVVFVFLHEMGHSLAAFKEGVSVRTIYLHPLGGLAQMAGQLPGPMAEMAVAFAGPFVSLLLAAFFFVPVYLLGMGQTGAGGVAGQMLYLMFLMNIMLGVFNLLPIFPMDGGRVMTAGLVMAYGVDRALVLSGKVARVGLVCLGVVGLLFVFGGDFMQGIVLIVLAVFLYTQGQQELMARQYVAGYTGGGGGAYEPWRMPDWKTPGAGAAAPEPGWLRKRMQAWKASRETRRKEQSAAMRREVDEVLRKVKDEGIGALTPHERDVLNRASRDYRDGGA